MTEVEICIDDVAGATVAEDVGADRVEVCAALSEGGTTPSIGLVGQVLARVRRIEVSVLVRPRGGDFVYSPAEVDVMCADIAAVRALDPGPVTVGFVVGPLTPHGTVDHAVLDRLRAACGPAPVSFHRAFDTVADQPAALARLVDAGVRRVLTSGGAPTAAAGADALRTLVAAAGDRITVMAGGSVRASGVAELVRRTAVPAVHLRATEPVGSGSRSATAVSYDDGARLVTAPGPVRAVLTALGR